MFPIMTRAVRSVEHELTITFHPYLSPEINVEVNQKRANTKKADIYGPSNSVSTLGVERTLLLHLDRLSFTAATGGSETDRSGEFSFASQRTHSSSFGKRWQWYCLKASRSRRGGQVDERLDFFNSFWFWFP